MSRATKIHPQKPKWLVISNVILASSTIGSVTAVALLNLTPLPFISILAGVIVGFMFARGIVLRFFATEPVRKSYIWFAFLSLGTLIVMPAIYINLGQ